MLDAADDFVAGLFVSDRTVANTSLFFLLGFLVDEPLSRRQSEQVRRGHGLHDEYHCHRTARLSRQSRRMLAIRGLLRSSPTFKSPQNSRVVYWLDALLRVDSGARRSPRFPAPKYHFNKTSIMTSSSFPTVSISDGLRADAVLIRFGAQANSLVLNAAATCHGIQNLWNPNETISIQSDQSSTIVSDIHV